MDINVLCYNVDYFMMVDHHLIGWLTKHSLVCVEYGQYGSLLLVFAECIEGLYRYIIS